jgi:ribosomal protein L11 methyltransferase
MKSRKPLWKISVATTLEAEDAVAEFLGEIFNSNASSYFDVEKGKSLVSIFCQRKTSHAERKVIHEGLKRIENCGLNIGDGKISIVKIRREDWAESWKRHFKPLEIGETLLVKPTWSKKPPRKNQAVVILDPGLSFGTGQHATTSFCLHEIVQLRKNEFSQSFFDIGTGSGILAIAAAKMGYKPVRAIDFDPDAVRIARANSKINKVSNSIHTARADVTKLSIKPKERFDLVCANLISNLLIAERKKIAAQMKTHGTLTLAGILRSEFPEVQKAFETSGLRLVSVKNEKEWRSGSFRFIKF